MVTTNTSSWALLRAPELLCSLTGARDWLWWSKEDLPWVTLLEQWGWAPELPSSRGLFQPPPMLGSWGSELSKDLAASLRWKEDPKDSWNELG